MAHSLIRTRWWRRTLVAAVALLTVALPTAFPGAAAAARPAPGPADTFVTRSGSQLLLGGVPFRFGGANIYWLGLDENVGGVDYPTYFRIDDALRTAKAMGATVVRSHTLGISTGNPLSFEPSLGTFNPRAFATIDYAVAAARRLGIRLVVPLADNWAYYHGGRRDFTNWFGLGADAFYTDPRVIAAYQDYIRHLLGHVNPYTGRAYGAEPTVLAWELGNELDGMNAQWVDTISSYLHQLAPHHLVAAPGISAATLGSAPVDIVDAHYYPPTSARILADAARVTDARKVYIAGEYGSTAATDELLTPLAADPRVAGTLFWSLFGRNDTHGYVAHGDGFTVHYPGDTPAMRRNVQAIEAYALAVHPGARTVPLTRPLLTSLTHAYGEAVLAWRGVATAVGYTVQRAKRVGGPWTTVSGLLSDADSPWIDTRSSPAPAWYRVVGQDAAGMRRASAPVQADPRTGTLVDPLSSWAATAAHSDGLVVRPDGDRVAVSPAPGPSPTRPQITWSHLLTTEFTVQVRAASRRTPEPTVSTSVDGRRWTRTHPQRSATVAGRYTLSLAHLDGVRSVRVAWPTRGRRAAHVTGAVLRYAEPAVDDQLSDLSATAGHTAGFGFATDDAPAFDGDASRLTRTGGGAGSVVWRLRGLTAAAVTSYLPAQGPASPLTFATSVDGRRWRPVAAETAVGTGDAWTRHDDTLTVRRAGYLRISWPAATGPAAQLGRVELFGPSRPVVTPAAFRLLAPAAGATAVALRPRFLWTSAARAGHYTLVVSTRADLSAPVLTVTGLRDSAYTLMQPLRPHTTYHWAVTATNVAGSTPSSDAEASFETFDPATMPLPVEDFAGYGSSDALLQAAYVRNTGGDPFTVTLDTAHADVAPAMAVAYSIGTAGYAGASRTFATAQDWSADRGLSFWLLPDGSGRGLTVQFQAAGVTWETAVAMTGTQPRVVRVPFADFHVPPWATPGPLDLSQVGQLSLYVGGAVGAGTFYVDSFAAYPA